MTIISIFSTIAAWCKPTPTPVKARIIPREAHNISRKQISRNALKVLNRLHEAGYAAYLVGGGVRDLLLGLTPKDFDVATDARPEEVEKLFRNCRLIGRRFRLAHVYFKRDIIEVATFRGQGECQQSTSRKQNDQGFLLRDNLYGNLEDDAFRRDFSINALYYNIADCSVVDYTNGLADLKKKSVRLIGDPLNRIKEDPLRMLRAIRIGAKTGCTIERKTLAPFDQCKPLLDQLAPSRVFDEMVKIFKSGYVEASFEQLNRLGFLQHLFPQTTAQMKKDSKQKALLTQAFKNTDDRVRAGKSTTPIFLLAVLLWPCLTAAMKKAGKNAEHSLPVFFEVHEAVIKQQQQYTQIPKFFAKGIKEIWLLQFFLERLQKKAIWRTYSHPRFRAAYDFYLLRSQTKQADPAIADWWTIFQTLNDEERDDCVEALSNDSQSTSRDPA